MSSWRDGSMDDLIKGMDDIVEGWMDRLVVMTWEVLWMMMDYATPESLSNSSEWTWPRPTGRKKPICTRFVAVSEHLRILFDTHHLQQNAPTPLCFTPTSTIQLPWNFPTLILQSIVEGGGLRFGDGDGDGGGSAAHCVGRLGDANLNLQLWGFLASEPANPIFGRSHQFRATWNPMVSYALHSIEHLR